MPAEAPRKPFRQGVKKALFASKNGVFPVKILVSYILTLSKSKFPPLHPPLQTLQNQFFRSLQFCEKSLHL